MTLPHADGVVLRESPRTRPSHSRPRGKRSRRIVAAGLPAGDDLARGVYGREDFRGGVARSPADESPLWRGRSR